MQAMLQQIAMQMVSLFRAKICAICVTANDVIVETLVHGNKSFSEWLEHPELYENFRAVVACGKPLCFTSLDNDKSTQGGPTRIPLFLAAQGIQAFVIVPMLSGCLSRGTLSLFFAYPRKFSDNELRYLSAIANTAAVALHTGEVETQQKQEYGHTFEKIVAKSDVMHHVFDIMQRAAATEANVLIFG